jgi:hypothetical protein
MKLFTRLLGSALLLAGLAACSATGQTVPAHGPSTGNNSCRAGGAVCRWDNQCCSSRCYVDTGCSG